MIVIGREGSRSTSLNQAGNCYDCVGWPLHISSPCCTISVTVCCATSRDTIVLDAVDGRPDEGILSSWKSSWQWRT